jgi:hypothetical protein
MSNTEKEKSTNATAEVSLKEALLKIQSGLKYIKSKWLIIAAIGALGASIGLLYSFLTKPKYTASCTFVLDDGHKGGGLSQYAGLASMAGIDIGGGGASDGLFQGDNILELYKSRLMIEKALLSGVKLGGKKQLLIDRYLDFNKLREGWPQEHITGLKFYGDPEKFNRQQDSVVTVLVDAFNKDILFVTKPDKKLSIIEVDVTSKDELFSKSFNDKLVQTVNNFYIQTKTKKATETVRILQKQVDSIREVLNYSISGVASAMDADPNANPSLISLRVPSQKRQIDVQTRSAIYNSVVQNLEMAKMSLRQGTPLIQIIDKPVFPLKMERVRKVKGIMIGAILSVFIAITCIVVKKFFNYVMR